MPPTELTHSYKNVLLASEEYFNGSKLPARIFVDKYCLKNADGELLEHTPNDMFHRISAELARIERKKFSNPLTHDEIFSYLSGFKRLVPQGGILFGAGNKYRHTSLANCFCCPSPYDSYGGIFYTDQSIAQLSKRRCGIGVDISDLRPRLTPTNNAAGSSTGPVSFAQRFADTVSEVGQCGRRGGGLLAMNIHHPDITEFIHMKEKLDNATAVNISAKITDEFMTSLKKEKEYEQKWPLVNPKTSHQVDASKVWRDIVKCAWNTGDPGLLFWDTIIKESIPDCYGDDWETSCTNVCSEIPLNILGSCILLAVNAYNYVQDKFSSKASFNFEEFYHDAQIGQRLLDDVIDLEIEKINAILRKVKADPEPDYIKYYEIMIWEKVKTICKQGRRTGLGSMGIADTLAALGMSYASKKSIKFLDQLYKTLKFASYRSSVDMAKELGSFPIWDWNKEKDNPFLKRIKGESIKIDEEEIDGYDLYHDIEEFGRRNISCLTSAPTGTISIEAQVSSAIEPIQFLSIKRKLKLTEDMQVNNDDEIEIDVDGNKFTHFIMEHPKLSEWRTITGKEKVEESPWYESCAHDIDPLERVKLQSVVQKHIDHSISSTINLPKNATQKLVAEIFELAYDLGLKGITVYRDGSRSGIITDPRSGSLDKLHGEDIIKTEAPVRPKELPCEVHHLRVRGQSYYVLVGLYGKNKSPYEVFCGPNNILDDRIKEGKIIKKRKGYYIASFPEFDTELSPVMPSASEMEEAITRLASTALRHGADIYYLVKQLEKVGEKRELHDFCRAISRALKKYITEGQKENGEICPECGKETIVRKDGCPHCLACGYSKCL